ncbi:MAG: UDP-N-acetylmuramate dehydrogenase [Opitutales bacterium]|nr:UDP-N-acetylmuramate dehydrogenase [Opitutales bacterium]MCH8539954.1 UDP-N-acetylmuramate dehydrogenase [Opitutales bacterium]
MKEAGNQIVEENGLGTLFPKNTRRLFFAGVSGMGMGPLAIVLKQAGYEVFGYDKELSSASRKWLEASGVILSEEPVLPAEVDVVIHSSALRREHPLLQAAEKKALPVFRRGEVLAAFTRTRKLIAVVGSHGKTTTTGLLVHYLEKAGFSFSYLMGALFQGGEKPPARFCAESEWLIAEVDESDGTIEDFYPEITLVLNLDWDHCDQYPAPEDLGETFRRLWDRTRGGVIVPGDCSHCRELAKSVPFEKIKYYGREGDSAAWAVEGETGDWILCGQWEGEDFKSSVPGGGRFNARNSLAVLAIREALHLPLFADAWADFPGIRRRQEILLQSPECWVVSDYAHHPGELAALWPWLRSLQGQAGLAELRVVFQSHRYTRTRQFCADFARLLARADKVYLLETYAASEPFLPGGGAEDLAQALKALGTKAEVLGSVREAEEKLPKNLSNEALWAFVGAGDIEKLAERMAGHWSGSSTRVSEESRPLGMSSETLWREYEPLAHKTTLRVGGAARYYAEPSGEADLALLLKWASRQGCPVFPLGRGSNLVIPPEGFPGLVFRLNHEAWRRIEFEEEPGLIRVGAGARLRKVCGEACRRGWGGFEFLEGIPATLGGALRMNAGAMGGWVFDVVEKVAFLTLAGEKKVLRRTDLTYGYRHCRELTVAVALEAWLRPPGREESENIRLKLQEYMQKRTKSQPKEPSAGCIFKNPEGTSAGKLIDESGLKGRAVGAAAVSPVHANFIVNRGGATAEEVIALVREVRQEVFQRKGVWLEPEVHLPGSTWEEVLKS